MNSYSSKILRKFFKNGLNPLHIAAFYGQAEFCRAILERVQANAVSQKGQDNKKLGNIKLEPGLTPLHLASLSGHEGLIRLLLNSPNVLVEAASAKTESIALHFGNYFSIILLIFNHKFFSCRKWSYFDCWSFIK